MAAKPERLYFVDWLRVLAFALLVAYHASVSFFPGFHWLIESDQSSPVLAAIMDHPRGWRLALLYFVSGMGICFALRGVEPMSFLRERFTRLMAPLLFAMCVLIVPQVWYERIWESGYDGSLLEFWLFRYFSEGRYPDGNLTWAHMWFVGYLMVMTTICMPVFAFIESRAARPLLGWFSARARGSWLYAFFLLPLILNLVFSPFFPRQTNALYNDGAWFATWASWFGLGYLVARQRAAVMPAIARLRRQSLAIAILLSAVLYLVAWTPVIPPIGSNNNPTAAYKMLLMPFAWTMILALTGYAAVYLNRANAFIIWANRGIFPVYIIHQTVVVAALFHVLPMPIPMWWKYAIVLVATFAGSIAFYELARLLPDGLKPLVGLPDPRPEASVIRRIERTAPPG